MHVRITALLFVGALAFACTPIARAQDLADEDADGVPDSADECLDTPAEDFVDAVGCSICDCEMMPDGESWPSRQAYFRCVQNEAKLRRDAGRLTPKDFRAALKRAKGASCGDENLTRCCIWKTEGDGPRCKVMDWERCDYQTLHAFDAIDWDVGSCLPNPCNEE